MLWLLRVTTDWWQFLFVLDGRCCKKHSIFKSYNHFQNVCLWTALQVPTILVYWKTVIANTYFKTTHAKWWQWWMYMLLVCLWRPLQQQQQCSQEGWWYQCKDLWSKSKHVTSIGTHNISGSNVSACSVCLFATLTATTATMATDLKCTLLSFWSDVGCDSFLLILWQL